VISVVKKEFISVAARFLVDKNTTFRGVAESGNLCCHGAEKISLTEISLRPLREIMKCLVITYNKRVCRMYYLRIVNFDSQKYADKFVSYIKNISFKDCSAGKF
jgi:hypothetical protein